MNTNGGGARGGPFSAIILFGCVLVLRLPDQQSVTFRGLKLLTSECAYRFGGISLKALCPTHVRLNVRELRLIMQGKTQDFPVC